MVVVHPGAPWTVIQPTGSNLHVAVDGYVQTNPAIVGTQSDNTSNSTQKLPVLSAIVAPTDQFGVTQENWAIGNMVPLTVDGYGHLQVDVADGTVEITYADDAQLDAFQRLRVAEPITLFDSKQIVDNRPLVWDDQQTSGSGTTSTYNTNQASTTMAVSNTTAGTRVRQTFERMAYQPGKSQFIAMTGIFGAGHSGITKRIGYFDGYNGVFFQQDGTGIAVGIRSNTSGTPTDTLVYQSNWNTDKLDGTGISGITLDLTKEQIFIIDFQWLGAGRIRFGFVIAGDTQHCEIINNANINSVVYMSNPNLPLRYEISNDGTGPAASVTHICGTVISEGGRQDTGRVFSVDRGTTGLTTNATSIFPLIAIRLKAAYQMTKVDLIGLNVINTTADNYRVCVLLNPTITGTALSFSDVTNSSIQLATPTNGTTISGGTQIFSGYAIGGGSGGNAFSTSFNGQLASDLRMGANIAGTSDIIVVGAQLVTGSALVFYGELSYRETV